MPSTGSGNVFLLGRGCAAFLISALFVVIPFSIPNAHAQSLNPSCFTKEECPAAPYNGRSSASEAPECAGESVGRRFYCYAPDPVICPPGVETENCAVKLAVSFGGKAITGGLGGYIAAVYSFLLSIVGILAGIMITVAGFEWLLAAGSSEKITHAKKRIQNAIIGMILALGSYLILQTVNPALTTLSLPPVKLSRRSLATPICCKATNNTYRQSFEDCDAVKKEQKVESVFCTAKITTNPARCADVMKNCGGAYQEIYQDQDGKHKVVDCVGEHCTSGFLCQILDPSTKPPIKGCRGIPGGGNSVGCPDLSTVSINCYDKSPQCVSGQWFCPQQGGLGQSGGPQQ
ncbi:MAG: pilin [Patescibacteria group bacterium]